MTSSNVKVRFGQETVHDNKNTTKMFVMDFVFILRHNYWYVLVANIVSYLQIVSE